MREEPEILDGFLNKIHQENKTQLEELLNTAFSSGLTPYQHAKEQGWKCKQFVLCKYLPVDKQLLPQIVADNKHDLLKKIRDEIPEEDF